jgi:hypothetical protein
MKKEAVMGAVTNEKENLAKPVEIGKEYDVKITERSDR